jgi:hypothetical protein
MSSYTARANQAGQAHKGAVDAVFSSPRSKESLETGLALARAAVIRDNALAAVMVSSVAGGAASVVGNAARPDNLVPGNTPCLDYGNFKTEGCDNNR